MSLTTLIPAIKTKAEAIVATAALGTLWYGEVPPENGSGNVYDIPYWKVQANGNNKVDQSFGTKYIESYPIQFDIYHTSLATCAALQDALHTNFDNASITLSSGTCIAFRRNVDALMKATPMTDKDGKPVYQAVSRYEAKIDKSF